MSISQLKLEINEVNMQIQETEARRAALFSSLLPYIDRYFTERIQQETDSEKRRDYAYFNASKNFEMLEGSILCFSSISRSGPITCYVNISEILGE